MKKLKPFIATLICSTLAFYSCQTDAIDEQNDIVNSTNAERTLQTLVDDYGLQNIDKIRHNESVIDLKNDMSINSINNLKSLLENSDHIVNNKDLKTLFLFDTALSSEEIYTLTQYYASNNTSQLDSKNATVSVYYEVKFYDTNGYKKQLYSWTGNNSTDKDFGSIEVKYIGSVANNKMSSYSLYILRTDKQTTLKIKQLSFFGFDKTKLLHSSNENNDLVRRFKNLSVASGKNTTKWGTAKTGNNKVSSWALEYEIF